MAEFYSGLTVEDLRNGRFSDLEAERLIAAEDGQWAITLLQGVGALELPQEDREGFVKTVQERWLDLAVETGIMPTTDPRPAVIAAYQPGPVPGFLY